MLVYEKIVDKVRHLFGTMGHIPSEDDVQLTYKDGDNQELSPAPTLNDTYLDNGHGGIIRKSDEKEVKVFIDATQIIPAQSSSPSGSSATVGTAVVGRAVVGQA